MNKSTFQNVSIKQIAESKTNPRGTSFERPEFNDLVASIKEKGIIVPIILRPVGKGYEVVAGSRRFRAAQKLKLSEIPASIQELSDAEAQEVQIIENLQRADVHPVDEGAAYRKLVVSGTDIKNVAIRVGKSETYVRDRLFLTNLVSPATNAYRDGKMVDGIALLIAKLSEADQADALEFALDDWDTPLVADMKQWIERQFYSPMERQPWLKGTVIMPKHLNGCRPLDNALFADRKDGVCTDLKCWKAHMAALIAARREAGLTPITDSYGRPETKGAFNSGAWKSAKGKEEACKSATKAIYVEGSKIGLETIVCVDAGCKTHWKDSKPMGVRKLTDEEKEARKKLREDEEKRHAKEEKTLMDAIQRVKFPLSEKHLDALLKVMLAGEAINSAEAEAVVKRLGLGTLEDHYAPDILEKAAKKMSNTEKVQIIFELLLRDNMYSIEFEKTLKSL